MTVIMGKVLAHERVADAPAINEHDPELASVDILVPIDIPQADRAAFEQLMEPAGRPVASFFSDEKRRSFVSGAPRSAILILWPLSQIVSPSTTQL